MSQKGAPTLLKKKSKVAFVKNLAQMLLKKDKNRFLVGLFVSLLLVGLMQKCAICAKKVTFLSIIVQFCDVTSVAE